MSNKSQQIRELIIEIERDAYEKGMQEMFMHTNQAIQWITQNHKLKQPKTVEELRIWVEKKEAELMEKYTFLWKP